MTKRKLKYLTSAQAAAILGFSHDNVRKLLQKGALKGEKIGRNWIITPEELKKVKRQRQPKGTAHDIGHSDK